MSNEIEIKVKLINKDGSPLTPEQQQEFLSITRSDWGLASRYITSKCGSSRFGIRLEVDDDGFDHIYPVRQWLNEEEKQALAEFLVKREASIRELF